MKKFLVIILGIVLALGTITSLAGCTKKEDTFKVGYISPGPDTWYLRAEEGAKWAAKKAGVEFVSVNSNRNAETEIANITQLINEGCDLIVMLSWNEAGSIKAAAEAKKAGIGCVVFDSCGALLNKEGVELTASVDFAWQDMGAMYANWMKTNHPDEGFVFINGFPESLVCQAVGKSLKDATVTLDSNAFVAEVWGEYSPATAADKAAELINARGDEFSIIGTINEDCASAIVARLEQMGKADDYVVFAQGGSTAGVELMKKGKLDFTISSSPGLEGAVAVFAGIDGVKNKGEKNKVVNCPIAPAEPKDAEDLTKMIPWEVNETVWTKIIKDNFSDYGYFFKD